MGQPIDQLHLHPAPAHVAPAHVQYGDGTVVDPQPAKTGDGQVQQGQQQAAQDGVMGHHQHGVGWILVVVDGCGVPLKQLAAELICLSHQFRQGPVGAAISPLQFEPFRGLAPLELLVGKPLPQLLAQQTAPGGQVDFQ